MKKTNHLLHAILTVLTLGLWGIVWIIIGLKNSSHNKALVSDTPATLPPVGDSSSALPEDLSDELPELDLSIDSNSYKKSGSDFESNNFERTDSTKVLPKIIPRDLNSVSTASTTPSTPATDASDVENKATDDNSVDDETTNHFSSLPEIKETNSDEVNSEELQSESTDNVMLHSDDSKTSSKIDSDSAPKLEFENTLNNLSMDAGNESESSLDHISDSEIDSSYLDGEWNDKSAQSEANDSLSSELDELNEEFEERYRTGVGIEDKELEEKGVVYSNTLPTRAKIVDIDAEEDYELFAFDDEKEKSKEKIGRRVDRPSIKIPLPGQSITSTDLEPENLKDASEEPIKITSTSVNELLSDTTDDSTLDTTIDLSPTDDSLPEGFETFSPQPVRKGRRSL